MHQEKENTVVNNMETVPVITRLIHADSLQEIVDITRSLVGNPILLTDLTHKLLAYSKEDTITDPHWTELIRTGGIPMDRLSNERFLQYYMDSLREKRPILDTDEPKLPIARCAVSCNEKLTGYLDVITYCRELTMADFDIIALASSLISMHMERTLHYGNSSDTLFDFFIADLLEGRIIDTALINERFRYFSWELTYPLRILAIRPMGDFYQNPLTQQDNLLNLHCERLKADFHKSTVFSYGREIRMLLPVTGSPKDDLPTVKKICTYLEKHDLKAGISRPMFDVQTIANYHLQAVKALEIGLNINEEPSLYDYDNIAIYHLMEYGAAHRDLMTFCHSTTFLLAEYDREHDTDLLETLHAFLNCHCNIAEAAQALFIHRNTMNYRMSKIYELTNIDLDNTETFFHLLLSFHLLEYYSITVMKDFDEQLKRKPYLHQFRALRKEPEEDETE